MLLLIILLIKSIIIRKSGEKEILLKDNRVMMIKQNIKLKSIPKLENKVLFVNNPNIGVIDIETYLAKDNTNKIYALGFRTVLDTKPIIYYINKED